MKTCCIHYFSATGNTRRAVDLIAVKISDSYAVTLYAVQKGTAPPGRRFDCHIIAFPVLSFAAPVFVRNYVRRFTNGNGTRAAVFCTCGGAAFQALEDMERLLSSRGYDVFYTGYAVYPHNWSQFVDPPHGAEADKIIERGDGETAGWAEAFLSEKRSPYRGSIGTNTASFLIAKIFGVIGRRGLGVCYVADDSCDGCGLCARVCPAGTIVMTKNKRKLPRWRFTCEDCNRCINICPHKAIQLSLFKLFFHIFAQAGIVVLLFLLAGHILKYIPATVMPPIRIAAGIVIYLLFFTASFFIEFVLVERLLFAIGKLRFLRPLYCAGYTQRLHRYLAPGFTPENPPQERLQRKRPPRANTRYKCHPRKDVL
ncbi:MAG: EFR1 family ferrodoxin [Spirochaetales bacterium]|nr:EFR1 family ferrodoxin [Spirochaetales bacterium]